MTSRFELALSAAGPAWAVQVAEPNDLPSALGKLGFHPPRRAVVVVGGATGLDVADIDRLRSLFVAAIVPVVEEYDAVGIDGGTFAGVMRLFGEARTATAATFPLLGVAAIGTVHLPGQQAHRSDTPLEPHHTHFVLVPGDLWGAEAPWIADAATALAGTAPSVTVLIHGGRIAYSDVDRSVRAARRVIVVAGSGRTADAFAAALAGDATVDERALALVSSGLIESAPVDAPHRLAQLLAAALTGRQSH